MPPSDAVLYHGSRGETSLAPRAPGAARPLSPVAGAPAGLDTPLQYFKGVGPQRARLLERLGLLTVRDGLNHFPRDYQDRREFVPFHKLPLGETGVVQGTVFGVAPPRRGSRAPGPGHLPGPDRLLHGALVRARLPRSGLQARAAGRSLRQEGARQGPTGRPGGARFRDRRGGRAGLDPHGPGRSRLRAHRGPVPAGGPVPPARGRHHLRRTRLPTSCPTSCAGGEISCRWPRRTGPSTSRSGSRTWRRPAAGSPSRTSSCCRSA